MIVIRYFTSTSGREPVVEMIRAQDISVREKIYEIIGYLEEYGFHLPTQYLRRISGTKKLWELRIKCSKQYRIFLSRISTHEILLLHCIVKKTQKTPKKEIEVAEERLKKYLSEIKEL